MEPEINQLHVMFLPLMAKGHMLPLLDIARLFDARGVNTTFVTTPLHATTFSDTGGIAVKVVRFPAEEAGLPRGIESLDQVITSEESHAKFSTATKLFRQSAKEVMLECRPHALVADMFFPWANDLADEFGIPRIVFYAAGFFPLCLTESLVKHRRQGLIKSDTERFLVPELPHEIKLTRLQLPEFERFELQDDQITRFFSGVVDSFKRSYGVIFNSFYELEPAYADLYKRGRKAWHVGPVSLCNRDPQHKARRGNKTSADYENFLNWLESKEPNSVIYVCLGSVVRFKTRQLLQIATGLEASGQQFIWVVREDLNEDKWLPKGFEEKNKERGFIIRGWAPQLLILEHEAVGGFMTHCGWNSVLEAVAAGVAMVTWPVFAEQFYNEKLVTEVLGIGVEVGAKEWVQFI